MSIAQSSISSIHNNDKYNVFLSYRDENTSHHNFVDQLYDALQQQHRIITYKENKKMIENSKLSIIVFSKDYISSSRCLDELVQIMECFKTTGHIILPVYYDVQPSEVRQNQPRVGFSEHNKEEKWKNALYEATNFVGLGLNVTTDGNVVSNDIKRIVKQVLLKLQIPDVTQRNVIEFSLCSGNNDENIAVVDPNAINLSFSLGDISSRTPFNATEWSVGGELIGMKSRIKEFESFLDDSGDVRMIGIKGIGGGGKTTLATSIFHQISSRFDGTCFLENVREASKAVSSGLKLLQEKVLHDVSNVKGIDISSVYHGKIMMKKMLFNIKVLLVLDDVDHKDQLEALAGASDWFKPGSRIIITTRDEHVLLAHKVSCIYDVRLLSNKEALCLFSWHAFGKDIPNQAYRELSLEVVRYAAGFPITLKVLGSFLCDKNLLEWVDALERLKTIPLKETLETLELSYVNLEDDYKEIFLDVACLLKGWAKDDSIRVLESCGFHARNGLKVLEQKSLLTVTKDKHLDMHNHIQEMGRNITRRLFPDDINKHSRLWIRKEIEEILANDSDTESTRAIVVDSPVNLSSEIVTKGFGNMKNLRLLYVVSEIDDEYETKNDQASPSFPNALRFLSWVGYPHWSLPLTFSAKNLVALEMPYSRIVQLWEGGENKVLNNLRFLNLRHSSLRTLDLSRTPNLERLDLEDCDDLVELHMPVGCLKIVFLNLSGCLKINSFLFLKQLESLEVLFLRRLNLTKFPDLIRGRCNDSLLELRFRCNNIEELPSSVGSLQKLSYLDLHSCINLRSLPRSICGLQHLRNLKLNGCILEELPEDIGHLECLEKLNLSFTHVKHLPGSFCKLKRLKVLNLSSCWSLEKLPDDLGSLECLQNLILEECTRVRYIPDSICDLKRLKYLSVLGCIHIENLPEQLGALECLEVLNLKGTHIRHLPSSISWLNDLKIYGPKRSTLGSLVIPFVKKQKIDLNRSFCGEQ